VLTPPAEESAQARPPKGRLSRAICRAVENNLCLAVVAGAVSELDRLQCPRPDAVHRPPLRASPPLLFNAVVGTILVPRLPPQVKAAASIGDAGSKGGRCLAQGGRCLARLPDTLGFLEEIAASRRLPAFIQSCASQLARAEFWLIKRHRDEALANAVGNTVPDTVWLRRLVLEGLWPERNRWYGDKCSVSSISSRRCLAARLREARMLTFRLGRSLG
jgi:hypothetical protein